MFERKNLLRCWLGKQAIKNQASLTRIACQEHIVLATTFEKSRGKSTDGPVRISPNPLVRIYEW